jgi:drug/metabolite transporter (DMT)-like permease
MPFFGSVLAITLLGERFGLHHAVGMALIIAGVALATRKR